MKQPTAESMRLAFITAACMRFNLQADDAGKWWDQLLATARRMDGYTGGPITFTGTDPNNDSGGDCDID